MKVEVNILYFMPRIPYVILHHLVSLIQSVAEDHDRLVVLQKDVEVQRAAANVAEDRFLQDSQMYRDRSAWTDPDLRVSRGWGCVGNL